MSDQVEFTIENGVLLSYNGDAASVTVPSGVTEIGTSAFTKKERNSFGYLCDEENPVLRSVRLPEGVTKIGKNAFRWCSALTEVILPDTLTEIEDSAFYRCESLTHITLPPSLEKIGGYAFAACDHLTEIAIPDGVTSLRTETFEYCTSLSSVRLPDTLIEIGQNAFLACSSLREIQIPDTVTFMRTGVFNNSGVTCLRLPESLVRLPDYAFYDNKTLEEIYIPDSITEIPVYCFKNCVALRRVHLPDGLISIGGSAFENCSSLEEIAIPDTVTEIGSMAFKKCTALSAIAIPDGVTILKDQLLYGCSALTTLILPDRLTKFEGGNVLTGCENLCPCPIPRGITYASASALFPLRREKKVVLPDGMQTVGGYAFRDFAAEEICLPSSVSKIEKHAFENCASLRLLVIEGKKLEVETHAFWGVPSGLHIRYCGLSTYFKQQTASWTYTQNSYDSGWGGSAPGLTTTTTSSYPLAHPLDEDFVCTVECLEDGVTLTLHGQIVTSPIYKQTTPYDS